MTTSPSRARGSPIFPRAARRHAAPARHGPEESGSRADAARILSLYELVPASRDPTGCFESIAPEVLHFLENLRRGLADLRALIPMALRRGSRPAVPNFPRSTPRPRGLFGSRSRGFQERVHGRWSRTFPRTTPRPPGLPWVSPRALINGSTARGSPNPPNA